MESSSLGVGRSPGGAGLNLAFEAVDPPCGGRPRRKDGPPWFAQDLTIREFTYEDLSRADQSFGERSEILAVAKGGASLFSLGRVPELYFTALGTLKNGSSVFCPIFSQSGGTDFQRLHRGVARVLVTTVGSFREKKIAPCWSVCRSSFMYCLSTLRKTFKAVS